MSRLVTWLKARAPAWLPASLGALYVLAASVAGRLRFAYERDPDEGYNLVKVLLVDRGHALYREVWSDQPPGFTYLGVVFCKLFGETVDNVRLVSTLLAALLLFALADVLRRSSSAAAGTAAVLALAAILPGVANYWSYSMSAMIGLPAIAWAVLALWALVVSESRRAGWLAASGVLFALSLTTKFLCAFLLPLFVALALFRVRSLEPRRRFVLRGISIWAFACLVTLLVGLGPALAAGGFEQLFETHLGVARGRASGAMLVKYLASDLWAYALAVVGFGLALVRRDPIGILLGGWALLAVALVGTHRPLWHHHVLLIGVPASGLAALAVGWFVEWLWPRAGWQRALGTTALAAGGLVAAWPQLDDFASLGEVSARSARQFEIDDAIRKLAPTARSIVTSKQIRAFRLGLLVPPELAVTSTKRYRSGQLSAAAVGRIVKESRPDIVIVDRRWPSSVRAALLEAVRRGYRPVYRNAEAGGLVVYVAESQLRE